MNIRDRIKDFRRVPAAELRPSPKNWRTHSKAQQDALRGILAEVGFAGVALARELPDGTLELIDGHLRAETAQDALIPVAVTDLNEAEAAKLLACYDPLGAMAGADVTKLDALLREVQTGSDGLAALLDGLAKDNGLVPPEEKSGDGGDDGSEPGGQYSVLIACKSEQEQLSLLERFMAEGIQCRALIV